MNNRRVFQIPGTDQYHDQFGRIVEHHGIIQYAERHDEYRNNQDYDGEHERLFIGIVFAGYILINLLIWTLQILVFVLGIGFIFIMVIVDVVSLLLDKKPVILRIDTKQLINEVKEMCVAFPAAVNRRIRE